ncbi:MAG: hypothetical protein KGI73_00745 [Patescibacteria group bacterium]|nr:hypothetical protein [Patescibacteria group bacterium]
MIHQELLAYVREQVSKGKSRTGIMKAALVAGWSVNDLNEALIALSVPMDMPNVSSEDADPAPRPVASAITTMPQPMPAAASMPPPPVSTGAMVPPVPVRQPTQPFMSQKENTGASGGRLPGVWELFTTGWRIYGERLGAFVGIGILQALWQWATAALLSWGRDCLCLVRGLFKHVGYRRIRSARVRRVHRARSCEYHA